jgi:methyl-accepting chemotaxis protein
VLRRLSISYRLMLFIPLLLVALVAVVWFSLSVLKSSLIEDRKESVKQIVQVGQRAIADWHAKEISGQLTREQAQKAARDQLFGMRFGDNNYYVIMRYDGVTLLHTDRSLEGKNRIETRDSDGVYTVRSIIEAGKRGGDFVYYRTPRTGGIKAGVDAKDFLPKATYALPFAPWEWSVAAGVFLDDIDATYNRIMMILLGIALGILVLGGAAAFLMARSISRPLSTITERMSRLADGDLSIEIPFLEDRHEMGRLARALNVFKVNRVRSDELSAAQDAENAAKIRRQETVEKIITAFHEDAARVIATVVEAAGGVQSHAGTLAGSARQSQDKIAAVNEAANNTSANVQTIASAAEELSVAVGEVNAQIARSTEVAGRAVAEADQTGAIVRSLADASERIGAIVQVIQAIASQTNLLALNATIEAARAGEAGRGFAVVASEVKKLAQDTTKATEEIQAQVSAIQSETSRAVEAITSIGATVTDMRQISIGVASAMEEQGATTQEIARSISQTASSTQQVSSNISGVAEAADTTNHAAGSLHAASEELQREAKLLSDQMTGFFGRLRAA